MTASIWNPTTFVPVPGGVGNVSSESIVYAELAFGIVGNTTDDQTDRLQELIDWVGEEGYAGTIIFPPGDIYYTGPLDWTKAQRAAPYYLIAPDRINYPTLKGAGYGATRFRLLGLPSNVTGMRWYPADTEVADAVRRCAGITLVDLDFYGQGRSYRTVTMAANVVASTGSPVITIQITGTPVEVGDAIGIRVALANGGQIVWFTVQSTVGVGPQIVVLDARQAIKFNITAADVRVLVAKQTRLLQFGGVRSDFSTVCQEVNLTGVRFFDSFSGAAFDDTTQCYFGPRCVWQGVNFNVEYGYNCDTFLYHQPYWGTDWSDVTGDCTNGSSAILNVTTSSTLRPGDHISDLLGLPTLNFPENTVILSVAGSTVIVSEPYSGASGSKTLAHYTGVMVATGPNASPFLGKFAANTKTGFTDTEIFNFVAGRVEALGHLGDTVGGPFYARGYMEASKRCVVLGQVPGEGSGDINLDVFIEKCEYLTGDALKDQLGVGRWDIRVTGVPPAYFTMGDFSIFSRVKMREGWKWGSANAFNFRNYAIPLIPLFSEGEAFSYNFGGGRSGLNGDGRVIGGTGLTWRNTAASGTIDTIPWAFVSVVQLTLVGATTINVGAGYTWAGARIKFQLTQDATGSRVLTFGAGFFSSSGSALGAISSGASTTMTELEFVSVRGDFNFVLVTPGIVWK